MTRVMKLITVVGLSVVSVGCATTGTYAHGPRHSEAEVAMAEQNTERSTLTLLSASIDPETAQAARRLALSECR